MITSATGREGPSASGLSEFTSLPFASGCCKTAVDQLFVTASAGPVVEFGLLS